MAPTLTGRWQEILALPDAQLRVAEVCKGHCQADEVAEWHLYVRDRLLVPFAATWSDPDEPDSGPQAVEVRAVREEADRRGVMVLCAIDGTQRTRWIGLEWLYVAEVRDEDWDASNALHVAARVLADYNFWVNELHGLDPSPLFFDDDDGSMMGGHALPFDLVDDDGALLSGFVCVLFAQASPTRGWLVLLLLRRARQQPRCAFAL